jgi:hypothetical protein
MWEGEIVMVVSACAPVATHALLALRKRQTEGQRVQQQLVVAALVPAHYTEEKGDLWVAGALPGTVLFAMPEAALPAGAFAVRRSISMSCTSLRTFAKFGRWVGSRFRQRRNKPASALGQSFGMSNGWVPAGAAGEGQAEEIS